MFVAVIPPITNVSITPLVIPEPLAANRRLWRGHSLASGITRSTSNSTSVFYSFIDDRNASGTVDQGDDFVVSEYVVAGTNAVPATSWRAPLYSALLSPSYGLACVNYLSTNDEVFFTGEPNGEIHAWAANTATGALQRQLFSAQYAGMAWHQLAAYRDSGSSGSGSEGLSGLCVDPTNPAVCNVVYWRPQSQLWAPAQMSQTAPITHILPDPSNGGWCSKVNVRIWDGEGNRSLPFLQYSLDGTNWTDATVWTLDGTPYRVTMGGVEAMPTGSTHAFIWNAPQDLGRNFTNSVLLRARSHDSTLWGDWSAPTVYNVDVPGGAPLGSLLIMR
jgi:hypothetical protein